MTYYLITGVTTATCHTAIVRGAQTSAGQRGVWTGPALDAHFATGASIWTSRGPRPGQGHAHRDHPPGAAVENGCSKWAARAVGHVLRADVDREQHLVAVVRVLLAAGRWA